MYKIVVFNYFSIQIKYNDSWWYQLDSHPHTTETWSFIYQITHNVWHVEMEVENSCPHSCSCSYFKYEKKRIYYSYIKLYGAMAHACIMKCHENYFHMVNIIVFHEFMLFICAVPLLFIFLPFSMLFIFDFHFNSWQKFCLSRFDFSNENYNNN